MRRLIVALVAVVVCLGAACAADDSETNDTTAPADQNDGTAERPGNGSAGAGAKFGTLDSPCGPAPEGKVPTIPAGEAGRGTDKLYIGVANERSSIRNGLLKELWDATTAFVGWCNEQGGINGLPLEAIDLDAKIFEVEAQMDIACRETFALVGGGWVQDNMMFSGKDGTDFHRCGLIAVPGFAVSPEFAGATDIVDAGPNPGNLRPTAYFHALAESFPDAIGNFVVVHGNLESMRANAIQTVEVARTIDGFGGLDMIEYDAVSQDWSVLAQQVISTGSKLVHFVGEPGGVALFNQALLDQNWDGTVATETNNYDVKTIESSGPDAAEGIVVRVVAGPFEEAEQFPATKQLIEILDQHAPGWARASLLANSFSANLLFATAAKQCADETGEITRRCVLEKGTAVTEWDAGGLMDPVNPKEGTPHLCSALMQVRGGKFTRLYPEVGGEGDDLLGMRCADPVEIEGDFGQGNRESSILDG